MSRSLRAVLVIVLAVPSARAAASTVLAPPLLPAPGTWIPTGGGTVRVLDKQKAESQLLTLKVGQSAQFETLSITLDACDSHAPDVPADGAGRLTVTDKRSGEPGFQGWMFANEPWVAMLQSPVYGVRVTGCEAPSAAAVAAVMPPPPAPPTAVPAAAPAAPGTGSGDATELDAPAGQTLPVDPGPPSSAPPSSTPPPDAVPPSGGDRSDTP